MASPRQTILQMQSLAKATRWATSPYGLVFGDEVHISPGVADDDLLPARYPFLFLNLGDAIPDPEDTGLLTQEILGVLVTSVEGHELGTFSLTGGASTKSPRRAYSEGRGIAEIETPLLTALRILTGADGAPIIVQGGDAAMPAWLRGRACAWRQYRFRAVCTVAEEWPPPARLVATGGAGQIALTWDLPAARFDLTAMVIRYASGATPPATYAAGTGVTLSSDLATSVTITSLAPGTYSVAAFAKYVDGPAADPVYSDAATGTSRASVTVT